MNTPTGELVSLRGRKRNAKKNRSRWAKNGSLRRRPVTAEDFSELQKGKFIWSKG